ncbi:MAG: biotin--[acetyl-CoA-carboxylase] ligase [Deltaproteobacteria bacterium]|nr:biotin--[acetyl-CoA-carboxylase] ligase [Deltaproteobacteria bacterium]
MAQFLDKNEIEGFLVHTPLKVEVYDELDSTNHFALNRCKQKKTEASVIIADRQTAGRGRLKRVWESPANQNLYFSILIKPEVALNQWSSLTLISGIACYRVLKNWIAELRLKWPNDLYVGDKKIGGILCEISENENKMLVIGVGINLLSKPEDFSEAIRAQSTSLILESKKSFTRNEIAGKLISEIWKCAQDFFKMGFELFRHEWEDAAHMKGKKIKVCDAHLSYSGICRGLDEDGTLLIERSGILDRVIAGDVIWED